VREKAAQLALCVCLLKPQKDATGARGKLYRIPIDTTAPASLVANANIIRAARASNAPRVGIELFFPRTEWNSTDFFLVNYVGIVYVLMV